MSRQTSASGGSPFQLEQISEETRSSSHFVALASVPEECGAAPNARFTENTAIKFLIRSDPYEGESIAIFRPFPGLF